MRVVSALTALIVAFAPCGGASADVPSGTLDFAAIKGGSGNNRWLSVSVLDIGQGNCILVTCPNGDQTIYDCGSSEGYSTKSQATKAFFANALVAAGRLKAVVISHGDIDHANKLDEILTSAHVTATENLYYGGATNAYISTAITIAHPTNVYGSSNTTFSTGSAAGLGCRSGNPTDGVSILAANVRPVSTNDSSIVARVAYGNFSILLTGDMERATERSILQNFATLLRSTAAVITHHGSSNRTNLPSFVTGVSPKVAVFSAGNRGADYAHPRCLIKALYEAAPVGLATADQHPITCYLGRNNDTTESNYTQAMFNTHDSGAVMIFSDGAQFSVWTCPSPLNLGNCVQAVAPRSTN